MPVPGGSQPQPYMGEMAPMDSSHQTMMWQQNQYMVDSGIHSGSTTQAPSVSSKHGALDGCEDIDVAQQMIYDFDRGYTHSGYSQDPISGTVLLSFCCAALNAGRSSHENVVCLSVSLSNAWIVTKRKKNMSRFLHHTKDHLA